MTKEQPVKEYTQHNQELYLEAAFGVQDPNDPNGVLIGILVKKRLDVNLLSDPIHAGEYITNDVIENPTTKKKYISHVQFVSLQTLNDIIECSNDTKKDGHTGQQLTPTFTVAQVKACIQNNIPLITMSDDVAFVADTTHKEYDR